MNSIPRSFTKYSKISQWTEDYNKIRAETNEILKIKHDEVPKIVKFIEKI